LKLPAGFRYLETASGEVEVYHWNTLATTLRGSRAGEFLAEVKLASAEGKQMLMAKLTGNYRRGNERTAKNHPRNR